jgi:hypothetical protein
MELKRLLQISITSVTFNATDTYMEELDTVCLREGIEETEGEEGAGRASAQLTLQTQRDKEVKKYILCTHLSSWCMGTDPGYFAESRSGSNVRFCHDQAWKIFS